MLAKILVLHYYLKSALRTANSFTCNRQKNKTDSMTPVNITISTVLIFDCCIDDREEEINQLLSEPFELLIQRLIC